MAAIGNHDRRRPFPVEKLQHHHRGSFLAVNRYHHLGEICRGSYGLVRRARDNKTGEIVAIKEEFHGLSQSTAREISILQSLPRHPSIVEFRGVFVADDGDPNKRITAREALNHAWFRESC